MNVIYIAKSSQESISSNDIIFKLTRLYSLMDWQPIWGVYNISPVQQNSDKTVN